MSSACECHIENQWCFYCEMYVPLEIKYQSAQQEIDRLRKLYERERDIADEAHNEMERLKIALHTHQSYDKTVSEMYEREQKLIELLKMALIGAKHESCMQEGRLMDSPDPTWHCCDWAELVDEIEKIGVAE